MKYILIFIVCILNNSCFSKIEEDTNSQNLDYNSISNKNEKSINKFASSGKSENPSEHKKYENNEELYKEDNSKKLKFSKKFPIFRILFPGFNFEGKCMNKYCEAYDNFCWSPLRLCYEKKIKLDRRKKTNTINIYPKNLHVQFNLGREMRNAKCPLCDHYLEEIKACGLSKCVVTFKTINDNKEIIKTKKIECTRNPDQFICQNLINDREKILEYEKTTVSLEIFL